MKTDEGYVDKILLCIDCREEFVFTKSAQQYFASSGRTQDPLRCKSCHHKHIGIVSRASHGWSPPGKQDPPKDNDNGAPAEVSDWPPDDFINEPPKDHHPKIDSAPVRPRKA